MWIRMACNVKISLNSEEIMRDPIFVSQENRVSENDIKTWPRI